MIIKRMIARVRLMILKKIQEKIAVYTKCDKVFQNCSPFSRHKFTQQA